jgi:hypothetical protein
MNIGEPIYRPVAAPLPLPLTLPLAEPMKEEPILIELPERMPLEEEV